MKPLRNRPGFLRWAITAVLVPFGTIILLRFGVIPYFWGDEIVLSFGNRIGLIFLVYLLGLAVLSIFWKLRFERRARDGMADQRDKPDKAP